ncbi:S1C family serine protease [Pengzhenrongella sp.]|uniref:S1C family serine protease n=1 Tax=Pengzhenrongella sp. TaxID=2888820 RepID=UPI002F928E20
MAICACLALAGSSMSVALYAVANERTAATDSRAAARVLAGRLADSEAKVRQSDVAGAALATRVGTLEATALDSKNHTVAKTAEAVKRSVVTIDLGDSLGSGFAVSAASGHSRVVTNFHVVADLWVNGGRDVKVRTGDQTWPAHITQVSEQSDLALIDVEATFPVLKIQSSPPAVGDPVIAVGSPLGLEGSVSTGIVSALRHEDGKDLLQTTAAINPGNSGGPLVNSVGAVVGINEMKIVSSGVEGLAFAIPASVLCAELPVC